MNLRNSSNAYGLISVALHWLSALSIYFLFGLGLYMTSLGYYDPWYHQAPEIHKGVGIIILMLTLFRFIWRLISPPPKPIASTTFELMLAKIVHYSFYLLLASIFITGYLISTAKGKGINVFDIFEVPAWFIIENDAIGELHEFTAFIIVGLSILHIAAGLLHHFKYRDNTLMRMLKPSGENS